MWPSIDDGGNQAEEATLTNMHARFASRLMNDLYLKANVKDTRFLFF